MSNLPVPRSANAVKRPISAWRIVGGAFLHFAVPAYIVTVAVATLLNAPAGASVDQLIGPALRYSGWFLATYSTLAAAATMAAAAIEPLTKGRGGADASKPAVCSRLRLTQALAEARSLPGSDIARLLDSIAVRRWNHDDSRFQALSQDLGQVVHTMAAANATASAKSRPELAELTARSLQRIDDALDMLAEERSRLDHGDAHAVARYVENRYGPSDFSGS